MINKDYVSEHGSLAENGYASSVSSTINGVSAAGVSLQSWVHLSSSIVDALKSEAVTTLTRCSNSYHECMMEVNVHTELGMVSSEILIALSTQTPHSAKAKVRCTLATQTPELYSKLMSLISVSKGEAIKENDTQAVNATSVGSSTTISIQLMAGDHGDEISIKRCKRTQLHSEAAESAIKAAGHCTSEVTLPQP
eukprot:976181-Amphidinium_carterae.3